MKKSYHKFLVAVDHKAGYPVYYTYIAINGVSEVHEVRNWIISNLKNTKYFDEVFQAKILRRTSTNRYVEIENVYTDGSSLPLAVYERAKFTVFDYEISERVTL